MSGLMCPEVRKGFGGKGRVLRRILCSEGNWAWLLCTLPWPQAQRGRGLEMWQRLTQGSVPIRAADLSGRGM